MSERNRRNRRFSPKNQNKGAERPKPARDREGPRAGPRDRVIPMEPQNERVYPDCAICSRPIRDIFASLVQRESGLPVHFDCVLRELGSREELSQGERLSYLGNGVFAVLRSTPDASGSVEKKRIQYEDKEKAAAWRRSLSVNI